MTCAALIGDPENGSPDEQQLEQQLRAMIELENISAFVFGYFGPFEQLALRVIQRLQKDYPLLDYTVMLTGRWQSVLTYRSLTTCMSSIHKGSGGFQTDSGWYGSTGCLHLLRIWSSPSTARNTIPL